MSYERNENMAQNKTKEKLQAELLAEAMHQQTIISHTDMVNHPPHYADSCSIECIEAMEITFGVEYTAVYCLINAYKYLWRRKAKNGSQDVKKALWYLDRCNMYHGKLATKVSIERMIELEEKADFMRNIADATKGEGEKENEK